MPIADGKLTRASAREATAEFVIGDITYSFRAVHKELAPEFAAENVTLYYGDTGDLTSTSIPYHAKFGPASLRFDLGNGLRIEGDFARTIDPVKVDGDGTFEQLKGQWFNPTA